MREVHGTVSPRRGAAGDSRREWLTAAPSPAGRPPVHLAGLDASLRRLFATGPVAPAGVGVAGFSDGASYALSLGLATGDCSAPSWPSRRASPHRWRGTAAPGVRLARPLRPGAAGMGLRRRVAAMLRAGGYPLEYREFEGGHEVPIEIRRAAVDWLLNRSPG